MSPKREFSKLHPKVQEYILENVRKAGSVKGACKRRGDSAYYSKLAKRRMVKQAEGESL
ncbi:MAG: hypothetical protein KGJ13_11985 [Patescibacteria group bacterium]|nr:hypothetical protein [Patescibacteria group bacterium]